MFLSKRSNGRYYVYYQQQNGKYTCVSTKTKFKAEASRFLTKFEKKIKGRNKDSLIHISLLDFFWGEEGFKKTQG